MNTEKIKKIFLVLLITVFSAGSFYLIKILTHREEPLPTVKTKAVSKTYKRILALNNSTPTRVLDDEGSVAQNNSNQTSPIPSPTVNQSLSPTTVINDQTPTEIPTPTSINLVTTPIVTEEGRELAYNNPTITLKNYSSTPTSQKTKTQTLPETGFYQISLGIMLVSLFVIIFALAI